MCPAIIEIEVKVLASEWVVVCGWFSSFSHLISARLCPQFHEDNECARFPLECPQECGLQIPREEVTKHHSFHPIKMYTNLNK